MRNESLYLKNGLVHIQLQKVPSLPVPRLGQSTPIFISIVCYTKIVDNTWELNSIILSKAAEQSENTSMFIWVKKAVFSAKLPQ